jgi:hypothetical protein
MYEILNVLAVAGALNENLPSISVIVPEVVPFTTTVTPGIGAPSSPTTFPESAFCCAKDVRAKKQEKISSTEILQKPFNLLFFINFNVKFVVIT